MQGHPSLLCNIIKKQEHLFFPSSQKEGQSNNRFSIEPDDLQLRIDSKVLIIEQPWQAGFWLDRMKWNFSANRSWCYLMLIGVNGLQKPFTFTFQSTNLSLNQLCSIMNSSQIYSIEQISRQNYGTIFLFKNSALFVALKLVGVLIQVRH